MSEDISMPFETADTVSTDDGEPSVDADLTDSIDLDSPVAATNGYGGDDDPVTYGSREERLRSQYESDNNTADEVDVRQLFDTPTVDYIRWQYRQNGMASTVVDKPVKDAYKHGFDLDAKGDSDFPDEVREWVHEEYVPAQKEARIKARRDGFALIFWILNDTNEVYEEIGDADEVLDLRVITLDRLMNGHGDPRDMDEKRNPNVTAGRAAEHVEYDEEQLVVTRSGLVVVDDITEGEDHGDFIGVLYERNPQLAHDSTYEFIHVDRLELKVNRPYVDGDTDDAVYGHVEGDSVLAPIIHALSGITKAEWALGQTLLRYTAPLHAVEIEGDATPVEGDWEQHISKLNDQLDNLTNKSNVTLPPEHSLETHGAEGDIDPEPFLDGLINDICAGSEITRSVLLGTQAGTVSGSSTDIKNYYNQVKRDRRNTYGPELRDAIRRYASIEGYSVPEFETDWGPLFKIGEMERVDAMMSVVSATSNAVNRYLLSQDEAREIMSQEWAEIGVDVDLGELTEKDMDELDRINTTKGRKFGNKEQSPEEEWESKYNGQNGGGREGGQTTDPSDPTKDRRGRSESTADSEDPSDPSSDNQ